MDIKYKTTETDYFQSGLNLKGNSDIKSAFNYCRSKYYCPFLQNGHLYHCAQSVLVHYYNREFNKNIIADVGIHIHSPDISGHYIIKRLDKPIETCKWCSEKYIDYKWEISKKRIDEWVADC
jgi:hypothetical protein